MVKYSDELTAAIAKRRKAKAKPPVAPPRLRRGLKKPKGTHKMPDGTVMSGKTHSKDSKPVNKAKKKMPKMPDMKAVQKKVREKAKAKVPAKKKPKFKVVKKLPEKAAPAKKAPAKAKPKSNKKLFSNLNAYLRSLVKSYAGKSTESDDKKTIELQKKIGIRGGTDQQAQSIIDLLKSRNDVFDYYSKLPDNTRFSNSPTSYLDSILRDFAYNKKEAGSLSGYQSRF